MIAPHLLWLAAVAVGVLGTVLVFAAVTVSGLFTPGVVLIDLALLIALAAAAMQLREREPRSSRAQRVP